MKKSFCILTLLFSSFLLAQTESGAAQFWKKLQLFCGQSFEGELISGGSANDPFSGKKLIMHVRSCADATIKIPFFVGDDKSRTWVLTFDKEVITLKHDHRHEDGTPDKITQYGGTASNSGLPGIQFFPADQETCNLISYAATNVWWITIDDTSFTYNLRRIGTDRLFTVRFDTTKKVATPDAPWGWNN